MTGSPELVIEVKSPSNTKAEIQDKAMTTLAGEGAVEFWVVDPKNRHVVVHTRTSGMHIYSPGARIPVPLLDGVLSLDELFTAD